MGQSELAEFCATAPLYTWRGVALPPLVKDLDPGQVILECPVCGGKRPFRDTRPSGSGSFTLGGVSVPAPLGRGPYLLYVTCGFCNKTHYHFWVETDLAQKRIRKVGQLPPWSIDIEDEIAEFLGDDVALFRKGLVCLSQGYGLGACSYFRRVLEDRVDSILSLLERFLAADPSTEEQARAMAEIRKGKFADKKLELAYPYVPASLQVAGHNPLKLLHDNLSQGVHTLSEDECSAVAQEISGSLVFVLAELARATSARERFAESVRRIGSRRRGDQGEPGNSK